MEITGVLYADTKTTYEVTYTPDVSMRTARPGI